MSEIIELTEETFRESAEQDTPLLVDFWAEWCAPCRAVRPILEEIASEQNGRLRVGKIDVDPYPELTRRLGIMSIPTLILFKKGEEAARLVGARPKEQMLREIEPHLA